MAVGDNHFMAHCAKAEAVRPIRSRRFRSWCALIPRSAFDEQEIRVETTARLGTVALNCRAFNFTSPEHSGALREDRGVDKMLICTES